MLLRSLLFVVLIVSAGSALGMFVIDKLYIRDFPTYNPNRPTDAPKNASSDTVYETTTNEISGVIPMEQVSIPPAFIDSDLPPLPIPPLDSPILSEVHVITNKPVYHYSFDDQDVRNLMGEETLNVKNARKVIGISGNAYEFEHFDDEINLPNKRLDLTQGTISFWLYVREYRPVSKLFSMLAPNPPGYYSSTGKKRRQFERIEIFLTENALHLGMGIDHRLIEKAEELNLKEWYLITLTWENNACLFYVNGEQKEESGYEHLYYKGPMLIGNMKKFKENRYPLVGAIDELKIWNRAIKPEEVRNEFQRFTEKRFAL